jgi:hypothetical protein
MLELRDFDARRAREGAAGVLKIEEIAGGGYTPPVCFCEIIESTGFAAEECA